MKLFISYSRDDKAWVYEYWRNLRDKSRHEAWIDLDLKGATRWWDTILDEIKGCECFIMVMTPRSMESIYCLAELRYAMALNKPILPIMLKPCINLLPNELKVIQFVDITGNPTLDDVLLRTELSLGDVRLDIYKGKYPPKQADRPKEPSALTAQDVDEVYETGVDALEQENYTLAEEKLKQVEKIDDGILGELAKGKLTTIPALRRRQREYGRIKRLLSRQSTKADAQIAWEKFVAIYPDYDPEGIGKNFGKQKSPRAGAAAWRGAPLPSIPKKETFTPPNLVKMGILPKPFAWCEIPAGKVTLEKGGYLKQETIFDVPTFYMAKYPITNAQYAKFIQAGGYDERECWTDAGWEQRQSEKWTQPRYWADEKWNGADYPVVGVSWYEAIAFARWLAERAGADITLPTEPGWQRAAQGDDGREYPYGNTFDVNKSNTDESGIGKTTPVTQYPAGASPYGVMDMSGNVWDWCLTAWNTGSDDLSGTDWRVLRGGSFLAAHDARSASRNLNYGPGFRNGYYGVRLCLRLP